MGYTLARHKILLFLIVSTFIITLISGHDYWRQWVILPIIFFILYLFGKYLPSIHLFSSEMLIRPQYQIPNLLFALDIMFSDATQFAYEPNYFNWKDVNEPDY